MSKDLTRLVRLSQSYLLPTLTDEARGVIYDAILAECSALSGAPTFNSEPRTNGWTPWPGGPCPVSPDTKVLIEFRDGDGYLTPKPASVYDWSHGERSIDIVSYKIVSAEPAAPDTDGWIPWIGGPCPVPEDTKVVARLKSGHVCDAAPASAFFWGSSLGPESIVAYKVVKPAAPDTDGWIPWTGGERPVSRDTMVVVRFRDGFVSPAIEGRGCDWQWTRTNEDIVAYKIVEPEPTDADDGWTPWAGGRRPVHYNAMVVVRLRGGSSLPPYRAGVHLWSHRGGEHDIVAYKVVAPGPAEPRVDGWFPPPSDTNVAAPADDGWLTWTGGPCPVSPDTKVIVRFRDGKVNPPATGVAYDWRCSNAPDDIVAYKLWP